MFINFMSLWFLQLGLSSFGWVIVLRSLDHEDRFDFKIKVKRPSTDPSMSIVDQAICRVPTADVCAHQRKRARAYACQICLSQVYTGSISAPPAAGRARARRTGRECWQGTTSDQDRCTTRRQFSGPVSSHPARPSARPSPVVDPTRDDRPADDHVLSRILSFPPLGDTPVARRIAMRASVARR